VLKIEHSYQMYEEHSRIELVYTRTFQQNVKKFLECARAKYSYKRKYLQLLDNAISSAIMFTGLF